ncbi:MAG: DUF4143 domain-containing protein [Burkholderiales bacterium]|nr:DUF4143 domain-containing protein [Burkholderiales bacterium]MBK6594084.1 DUF4143 domain-containing protein [Burkholderiales bacterium]
MLVRRLPGWSSNVGKLLSRPPKVFVRDSGLHALMGLKSLDAVLSNPVAGSSWEGLVVEHLINKNLPHKPAFTRPAMKPS